MKKFIAFVLVAVLCMSVFAGCKNEDNDNTKPSESTGATEPTKSALEIALEGVVKESEKEKVFFDSLNVAYEEKSVSITQDSNINDIKSVFEGFPENIDGKVNKSTLECGDPNVYGVKERLVYKRILEGSPEDNSYWNFMVDSCAETDLIKWVELDPLSAYNGEVTPTINGIGLYDSFNDLLSAWGKPDYAGVSLKNGKNVIIASWEYDMGINENYGVRVNVCVSGFDGENLSTAIVHDIYVNMLVPQ